MSIQQDTERFLVTLNMELLTATPAYAALLQDAIRAVEKTIAGRRQHRADMARLGLAPEHVAFVDRCTHANYRSLCPTCSDLA